MNNKTKTDQILFFLICVMLTIVMEISFNKLNVRDENIYLFFVLAIFVIINETKQLIYGVLGAISFVISFNFFITEPKYSFVVDDPNYYLGFIIFIIVTLIISSLVIGLQKQINLATTSELTIKALYRISTDFLNSKNRKQIYNTVVTDSKQYSLNDITIITEDDILFGKTIDVEKYRDAISYAKENNVITGYNENQFTELDGKIFPIADSSNYYGVLICTAQISERQRSFIANVIEELLVVLDRDASVNKEAKAKIEFEKEKFRNSLLRGLSHDIKTPLTMIQSGSNFLYESFDKVNDDEKKNMINDIYNESCELSQFVANLLDMTRLDENRNLVNRSFELIDDILFEVNEKVKRRLGNHKLIIKQSEEIMMVYADLGLLTQVFVNLVDNAIKHTRADSTIEINYYAKNGDVVFEVKDNGGGIDESKKDKIFEDFYSITTKQDHYRSSGLGLGICQAIVNAHQGKIEAFNNEIGGATFRFTIAGKEV